MDNRLDLPERARFGLNFLANNVDKNANCLPYFWTLFNDDPAEARHDWPDFGDLTARYVESFIVARRMLGIAEPTGTERTVRKTAAELFQRG